LLGPRKQHSRFINFIFVLLNEHFTSIVQVATGNLCAILGPSGAGKSSLLNILAGRSGASSDCVMKVGAIRVKPANFRRHIAYVAQEDSLMATATPREALMFSARLRLPAEVPAEDIVKTVEKLLKELGLLECADVMIGSALVKGISGGQRKRTSVGVELVTDPMVRRCPFCLIASDDLFHLFCAVRPHFLSSHSYSFSTSPPPAWTPTLPA
jgi:ABC-type Fe3+/spermidine/putrescine transport system ATPase subunit